MTRRPASAAARRAAEPAPVAWERRHRPGPGFAFRREAFGGILFHFEGRRPDPRVSIVDSPFLVQLLELVEQAPLGELLDQAAAQFGLDPAQERTLRAFFTALVERGALVPA